MASHTELAHFAHVSPSRLAQIIPLANLAPDVQETLLFLAADSSANDSATERQLRQVVAGADWEAQRSLWQRLMPAAVTPPPTL